MKLQYTTLLVVISLSISCTNGTENDTTSLPDENSRPYTGPIIDMHIHAFNEGNPLFGMTHPPTLRNETYEGVISATEQKEKTLAKFREHNIVKAVVANGQIWFDESPEVILIGGANKEVDSLRNRYRKGALHAIAEMAPFYGGRLADDSSQMPYFELAQELNIPVGFHIFPGGPNYGFHLAPEMLGGMRTYNARPLQLEDVIVKYPDVKVYIMHGGWPYVEDVKALMYAHPNVYVDIAVLNWILPKEELSDYLKSLMNAGFGDRIMYGSDQMVWPEVISVGIETVNDIDFLTSDQKEDIFYDNAAEFLEMTAEEIEKHKRKYRTADSK